MDYHSTKISSSSHSGRGLNSGSDSNLLEGHEYVPRVDTYIKQTSGTKKGVFGNLPLLVIYGRIPEYLTVGSGGYPLECKQIKGMNG